MLVFYSPYDTSKHISIGGVERHMKFRLGLGGVHSPHSYRSTLSTWANAQTTRAGNRRWSRDDIELLLDHTVGSQTLRSYNRRVTIARLRPIIQAYADALEAAEEQAALADVTC